MQIGDRLLGVPDAGFQVIAERLGVAADRELLDAKMGGQPLGGRTLVERRTVGHLDGEDLQPAGGQRRRGRCDRSRVDAAAEIHAHRHVGPQAQPHRLVELPADDLLGVLQRHLVVDPGPQFHVPVLPQLEAAPKANHREVPRGDWLHVNERDGDRQKRQGVAKLDGVQIGRPQARGEDPFRFGRQDHSIAAAGVEERLDAEAVASGNQQSLPPIQQQERELAAQVAKEIQPVFPVQGKNDLGVRAGREPVAALFELRADSLEVIDLAVRDQHQLALGIQERLVARNKVDHRKPRVGQTDAQARDHDRRPARPGRDGPARRWSGEAARR